MLAVIVTLLCALAIDPQPGAGVLAVVLCLSLSRSHLDRDLRGRIEAACALPVVGLAAIGVGMLLHRLPWLGALVFVSGIFVSIWLRRFGALAKRLGSLIALPFIALLVTPRTAATAVGPVPALLVPVLIGLLALFWVSVAHALASRAGLLAPAQPPAPAPAQPPAPAQEATTSSRVSTRTTPPSKQATASTPTDLGQPSTPVPTPTAREGAMRPIASTRMAIQMAVGLAVSFVIGYTLFAERWAWIVLTAFIVASGNHGRLEVAYKSVLRVLGAAAGTLSALALSAYVSAHGAIAGAHGLMSVGLILGAVFIGVWLRPLGYAWWALFITIALALLQGFSGGSSTALLWPRLEEIVIGAVIAVVAAWWVLPVSSSAVLRKRIADALAVLSDAIDPATPARPREDFIEALDEIEKLAPAFRVARIVTRRFRPIQPADWIDVLQTCTEPALALIDSGASPPALRRAVGNARKALREPSEILPALEALHAALRAHMGREDR